MAFEWMFAKDGDSGSTSTRGSQGYSKKQTAGSFGWMFKQAEDSKADEEEDKTIKKVNELLDKGWSWEDISRDTGVGVDAIKQYTESNRPGYGVKGGQKQDGGQGLLEKIGSGVGNFAKESTKFLDTIGTGVARALPGGTADVEARGKASERESDIVQQTIQRLKQPGIPERERRHLQKLLQSQLADQGAGAGQVAKETKQLESETDKRKFAASAAELGLLAASGGISRAAGLTKLAPAARTGAPITRAVSQAGRMRDLSRPALARAAGITGAEGAAYGGVQELQQDDPTLSGGLRNMAIGGVLGGAIPVVGRQLGKVADATPKSITETALGSKAAQTRVGQKVKDIKDNFVAKVVDDTNFVKQQFKGVRDESGELVNDKIKQLVTNVRQFDGLTQDRLQNNTAYQQLKGLIGGNKQKYNEFQDFIKKKQDAINANKLGDSVDIPVGTAEQESAYRLLNQSTKDDIQYLFDNGKITKDKYDQWIADPDYTRVQREVLEDQANQIGSSLVGGKSVTQQRLKGSSKEAVDPFAAYEDWARRLTVETEKNNLAKYIRDQGLKTGKIQALDPKGTAVEQLRKIYGETGVQQKSLKVLEDGVEKLYSIDPKAAKQLSGLTDLELKAVADWVLFPSRVLRGGATSLNVAFSVPNFIRDQMFSGIVSKNARATHNPIAFFEGLKEAVAKPALRTVTGGKVKAFQPNKAFQEYLKRNANMTRVDLARNLKKATRRSAENLGVKKQSPLRAFESIISASENATRYQNFVGTYKNALKKNIDPEKALEMANNAARENSINFSNRGEISKFMKIFNPYFNAGVQGSARLARSLKDRPVATGLKIGTSLMMPVAASTYYNLSDPERAELYARIPSYERDSNIIFVLGGGRGYVKVPLTPGLKEFANPLRNMIESEYLGNPQGILETAKNLFVDPFSPIGTSTNEVLSQAVPQAVKPLVEIGMNRDLFTGNPVVGENMLDRDKPEQAYDSTPQIFKDLGKITGQSPLQIRKLITGYSAGGGEGAITLLDAARGANTGGRSTPEQLLARFYAKEPRGVPDTSSLEQRIREQVPTRRVTIQQNNLSDMLRSQTLGMGSDESVDYAKNQIREHNMKVEGLLEEVRKSRDPNKEYLIKFLEGQKASDKDYAIRKRLQLE